MMRGEVHPTLTYILHRYARHSIGWQKSERERVHDMKCDLTVGPVTVYRSIALVVFVTEDRLPTLR